MIYILLGIIVLLVIILVAMGIVLWQDKDYVYTREDLNEETFSTRQECQDRINMVLKDYDEAVKDRNEVITSLQGKLKDKNQVFNTSYDFLNNLIDEERRSSFKFENKYNVGDNIWYVKDNKTYQGKIKTITTELFKTKNDIKATQYIYLLECGNNTKESEIICA